MWWSIFMLCILVPLALAGGSLAPWVPTVSSDLRRVQDVVSTKKTRRFLEFGCGDARVSHYIAKHNPDIKVTGIELALPMFVIAKIKSLIWPLPNLTIEFWSGFKKNFWDFDSIYLFAMPDSLKKKVLPKFEREAQKWTRLISYVFSMSDAPGTLKSYEERDKKTIHVLTR